MASRKTRSSECIAECRTKMGKNCPQDNQKKSHEKRGRFGLEEMGKRRDPTMWEGVLETGKGLFQAKGRISGREIHLGKVRRRGLSDRLLGSGEGFELPSRKVSRGLVNDRGKGELNT